MEKNHFSHIHHLARHQNIPQGHDIYCSGCKLEATGALVYVCWECRFFLHEQCFNASRSMIHPSHPPHPLTLAPYPTYPSNSFYCNSCNLIGTGFAYSCSLCEFDIHIHCAYMTQTPPHHDQSSPAYSSNYQQHNSYPNHVPDQTNSGPIPVIYPPQHHYNTTTPNYPNASSTHKHNTTPTDESSSHNHEQIPKFNPQPSETKHFTHAGHPMYLTEVREKQMKVCAGCNENITGLAYVCKYSNDYQCEFNLHKSCFDLPQEIRHKSHPEHPLALIICQDQNNGFTCNACNKKGYTFTYNCKICQFDLHSDCVSLPKTVKRKDHEHPLTLFTELTGSFRCDVCQDTTYEACWRYRCRKCDFDTHTFCVASDAEPAVVSNPELDYYKESEKVMAALVSAKIRHDSNAFILNHLI